MHRVSEVLLLPLRTCKRMEKCTQSYAAIKLQNWGLNTNISSFGGLEKNFLQSFHCVSSVGHGVWQQILHVRALEGAHTVLPQLPEGSPYHAVSMCLGDFCCYFKEGFCASAHDKIPCAGLYLQRGENKPGRNQLVPVLSQAVVCNQAQVPTTAQKPL